MKILCRHLSIHGRVQGVGYRWSLCAEAAALGLRGWVRNRRDGSVEALLEGVPEAVERLTVWAQRGPPAARVERVIETDRTDDGDEALAGFAQRPTV
jgi:acylphosphatase